MLFSLVQKQADQSLMDGKGVSSSASLLFSPEAGVVGRERVCVLKDRAD